jgi:hypothetical protein
MSLSLLQLQTFVEKDWLFTFFCLWINDALEEKSADAFGTALNAAEWAECRMYSVQFLK